MSDQKPRSGAEEQIPGFGAFLDKLASSPAMDDLERRIEELEPRIDLLCERLEREDREAGRGIER